MSHILKVAILTSPTDRQKPLLQKQWCTLLECLSTFFFYFYSISQSRVVDFNLFEIRLLFNNNFFSKVMLMTFLTWHCFNKNFSGPDKHINTS